MSNELAKLVEEEEKRLEDAVNQHVEDTLRSAWLTNTLVWVGVAAGGFVVNLLLLWLAAGGR